MAVGNNAAPAAAGRFAVPLRLEHLWALLPLALVGALLALAPTTPHDFWWHLRVGQVVAEQGVPRVNRFAWGVAPETPFVYAAWLADWLFYRSYELFGLAGPVLVRNMLGMAGFALVAVEARRRSGSWRLTGLAVLLAGAMSINNLTTRPQNFVWPVFAAFALVLGAYRAHQVGPRALVALPLLILFWVNAHGSFVLGLALLAITLAGEGARTLLRHADALDMRHLVWLAMAGAACLAATLVNPIGPGIFGYVARLLGDPASQNLVNEWQPPSIRNLAGTLFFIALVGLVAALALGRGRPTLTDVLLVCAFLWLALGGMRYVVWFGMIAMPVLAQCLGRTFSVTQRCRGEVTSPLHRSVSLRALRGSNRAAERWFTGTIALLLAAGIITLQPPLKATLPLPAAYKGFFAAVPGGAELFTRDTPVAAAEFLRRNPVPGLLWNDMAFGSYLIWAVPDQAVFVDPRVELFPLDVWQEYLAVAEARDYNRLLIDTYDVERVLLDHTVQPKLAAALAADPLWRREYSDERAEIYRRAR